MIQFFALTDLRGYQREFDLLRPEVRQGVMEKCEGDEANVWWIAARAPATATGSCRMGAPGLSISLQEQELPPRTT